MLDKGVPSAFANVRHLYSSTFKRDTISNIVQNYIESGDETKEISNGDVSKGKAAALYFLAQHYNYHITRDLNKAMSYVDKAIELDPKSVEYQLTKARIHKHQGDLRQASSVMEQARKLDVRDRYINTKAAKYQLRNNESTAALNTLGMFTRADATGGALADLHDMQCMWFLTEDGDSYVRQRKTGLALKRYTAVHNIFDVWQEDQFDFHQFVLRKGQVRAYVDMIRWEDRLRAHPSYTRAALAAIQLYVDLHDRPLSNGHGANGDAEDAAERKRAAKKARKDAQKAEQEAALKKASQSTPARDADGETKKKDDDPDGQKLAATKDPLGDAMKFVNFLLEFSPKRIDCQLLGFEVFLRRRKSHSQKVSHICLKLTMSREVCSRFKVLARSRFSRCQTSESSRASDSVPPRCERGDLEVPARTHCRPRQRPIAAPPGSRRRIQSQRRISPKECRFRSACPRSASHTASSEARLCKPVRHGDCRSCRPACYHDAGRSGLPQDTLRLRQQALCRCSAKGEESLDSSYYILSNYHASH